MYLLLKIVILEISWNISSRKYHEISVQADSLLEFRYFVGVHRHPCVDIYKELHGIYGHQKKTIPALRAKGGIVRLKIWFSVGMLHKVHPFLRIFTGWLLFFHKWLRMFCNWELPLKSNVWVVDLTEKPVVEAETQNRLRKMYLFLLFFFA